MKHSLIQHLRCPITQEEFNLYSLSEERGEIKEGVLISKQSKVIYPIINYIPILLDFKTFVVINYLNANAQRLKICGNYRLPNNTPRSGEEYVQKEFSQQWIKQGIIRQYQYGYEDKDLYLFIKIQLGLKQKWFRKKMILNIGCGAGKEAIMLNQYSKTDVFAVDLNYSLLELGSEVTRYKHIHFIQASLFSLPFRKEYFHYVFSHGVLHHTYSTKNALRKIAEYIKKSGYLYIWVYGYRKTTDLYSGLNTILVQYLIRPLISRCGGILSTIVQFPIVSISYLLNWIRYLNSEKKRGVHPPRFYDIFLQVRDSHSVYHSHWQSMAEVIMWMKEMNLKNITPLEIEKIPRRLLVSWVGNVGLRAQNVSGLRLSEKSKNSN